MPPSALLRGYIARNGLPVRRYLVRGAVCPRQRCQIPLVLEGGIRSGRIAARRSPDDVDDLLQFGWREPGDNLVHALRAQQENGRPQRTRARLRRRPSEATHRPELFRRGWPWVEYTMAGSAAAGTADRLR